MERDGAYFFKIRVKKYDSFPFRPDGVLAEDLPGNIEGGTFAHCIDCAQVFNVRTALRYHKKNNLHLSYA